MTLFLAAGATLLGATNLDAYQQPEIPSYMPEARWGKWHRALIVGENVEDVHFAGQGVIDGNRVFDPTRYAYAGSVKEVVKLRRF